MRKWDARFLSLANVVATFSKDKDKQVGAVLVSPDKRQLSIGYNGLPRHIDDTKQLSVLDKLSLTVHAEMNAILNCPQDTSGWYLYVTKLPCVDCAKHIIQAGIAVVISRDGPERESKWFDSQRKAIDLLTEAKVIVHYDS